MPSKKSALVKEYQPRQISLRGPGSWDAKPAEFDPTIILRYERSPKLTTKMLAPIFNAIAKDYPHIEPQYVKIENDRVTFIAHGAAPGYKRLKPETIAARG